MTRARCITRRAKTEFGSMYCHIDLDAGGRPVGGSISTPQKEPEAQITRLVHTLSAAWNDLGALKRELIDMWAVERAALAKTIVKDVEEQRGQVNQLPARPMAQGQELRRGAR